MGNNDFYRNYESNFLEIFGFIFSIITCGLIYYLFYEFFFEHEIWHNKRLLYKEK